MSKLEELLLLLDGKEAVISQILSALVVYLMAIGVIDKLLGALFQTIILVLTGGAVTTTNSAVADTTLPNTFGAAVRRKRASL